MPIYPGDVPNEAVKAVSHALAHRAATCAFFPSGLGSANARALAITMPHRVAYVALEDVVRNTDRTLDTRLREIAQIGCWRFLVQVGSGRELPPKGNDELPEFEHYESIASATTVQSETGEYQLGELNEGPFVRETEHEIRSAEKLEEVKAGHFEAFFLVVPAIYVGALWLQDRDGKDDKFIPMRSPLHRMRSDSPMTDAEFLGFLDKLAKKLSPNYS
jgi:hypothetical protein